MVFPWSDARSSAEERAMVRKDGGMGVSAYGNYIDQVGI